ncbi:stabilizer of axonemal microtubules 2-like [Branchiostoma lanceolatum]|uniref:stabilizer of axonemal microtubules 2-like n=1 Tax=Branchiostoma lanceolatum TaxID=7740 RepID=UPI003456DEC6
MAPRSSAKPRHKSAILPGTADTDVTLPDGIMCICELCDCGRHKHHKGCKKVRGTGIQGKMGECALTHYQETFKHHRVRPRMSRRPPPTARDPRPARMDFMTVQKNDYQLPGVTGRVGLIKQEDNYELPNMPVEGMTEYRKEFLEKSSSPAHLTRPVTTHQPARHKLDSRTANRDFYKPWVPQPRFQFGELPTFTGSILYPNPSDSKKHLRSVTMADFPEKLAGKTELVKSKPDNILLEGSHDLETTNMKTYRGHRDAAPASRAPARDQEMVIPRRGDKNMQTKYQFDFKGRRQARTKMCTPAPETIRLTMQSRMRNFETEQMGSFPGYDARVHPRPDLIRKEQEYQTDPNLPFEGTTITMQDFRTQDLHGAYNAPAVQPQPSLKPTNAKLDGTTMNNQFFQDWGTSPRVRFGDFHEGRYIPPLKKFEGYSTTKHEFVPLKAEKVTNYKPENKPVASLGEQDLTTIYKQDFLPVEKPMCRAEEYLLKKQLKSMKKKAAQAAA